MRLLVISVLFGLMLLVVWLAQHSQPADSSLSPDAPLAHSMSTGQVIRLIPQNDLEEKLSFLYGRSSTDDHQTSTNNKPIDKKMKSTITKDIVLNLDLPATLQPTSTPLSIPDSQKLILEQKKAESAGISVSGGIEWDQRSDKAKGATISITIPTG